MCLQCFYSVGQAVWHVIMVKKLLRAKKLLMSTARLVIRRKINYFSDNKKFVTFKELLIEEKYLGRKYLLSPICYRSFLPTNFRSVISNKRRYKLCTGSSRGVTYSKTIF